jgi:hypothetical protein
MSNVERAVLQWLGGSGVAIGRAGAVGWLPTERWAGPGGPTALAAGCGVALAGAMAGALPVLRALARPEAKRGNVAALVATALRSGVTVVGTLVVVFGTSVARAPFVLWVAWAYAALLVAETRWTVRWLGAGAG